MTLSCGAPAPVGENGKALHARVSGRLFLVNTRHRIAGGVLAGGVLLTSGCNPARETAEPDASRAQTPALIDAGPLTTNPLARPPIAVRRECRFQDLLDGEGRVYAMFQIKTTFGPAFGDPADGGARWGNDLTKEQRETWETLNGVGRYGRDSPAGYISCPRRKGAECEVINIMVNELNSGTLSWSSVSTYPGYRVTSLDANTLTLGVRHPATRYLPAIERSATIDLATRKVSLTDSQNGVVTRRAEGDCSEP